jgi:hypothetical protein
MIKDSAASSLAPKLSLGASEEPKLRFGARKDF